MGSSRERASVKSKASVSSVASKKSQQTGKETNNNSNANAISMHDSPKNNFETRSERSSLKSRRSRVPNRSAGRRRSNFPNEHHQNQSISRHSSLGQISGLLSGKSVPQEKPPTKVTHILQKRTPYVKYDPWKNVEEGPIQLLLLNEVAKGRLKSQDNEMKEDHEKRLRALRHWGYLRRVARAIGRNQRDMKLREKARLEAEMEQRRQALAEEEALMEKAKREANDKEKKERLYEEEKREVEEAESIDYDPIDLFEGTLQVRSQSVPLLIGHRERSHSDSDPRLVHSLNDLPSVDDVNQNGCKLTRDPFSGQMMPMFSTSTLRQQSIGGYGMVPDSRIRLLDVSTDAESNFEKEVGDPIRLMEQNDLFHSEEGLEVDLPPPPPPSNPPPVEDSDAEELVTNRRSIFAAPSWNSEVEGDLERVHKELMERPLAYSGIEKPVDVPDHIVDNFNHKVHPCSEKNADQPALNVQRHPRKFVFAAPSVLTVETAAKKEPYSVSLDNELTSKEDSYNTVDSEEEEGKDDSVFEKEENEKEKKKSKEIEESFDWLKEYERRREEVLRQKKELENLEHKALRFQEDDVVAPVAHGKTYVREFLHGYSILPENYTGKIVINIHYGVSQYIPIEARIKNAKEQLYVGVSHIFDFSRFESLNKKRPMVAFKLRPFDKSFHLPKGAEKYREVELNRKTGEVSSGDTSYCTYEIAQKAVMKRWLLIRVKAYHKNIPQNFLGEIKIDFRDYEKAEDIQIMDKVAYLYGKFEQVGSVDVEMNYKVQQGCLVITVLKANLLPTVKSTGDTYMKIYHTYMGRMVEKVRTSLLLETFMPEYNESFTFKLPKGMVEESTLHFKLMSKPAVAVSKDSITGEVKLAQRTNCNDWKNFFVGALMCKHPVPTQATLPLMRYIHQFF